MQRAPPGSSGLSYIDLDSVEIYLDLAKRRKCENMSEEKQLFLKSVKSVASEFAGALQSKSWDEAFEISGRLNTLLNSDEIKDFTERELEQNGILEVKENHKKYRYWSNQRLKVEGALVAKGKNISEALGL